VSDQIDKDMEGGEIKIYKTLILLVVLYGCEA